MQIITIKQSLIPFRENLRIIGSFFSFFLKGGNLHYQLGLFGWVYGSITHIHFLMEETS